MVGSGVRKKGSEVRRKKEKEEDIGVTQEKEEIGKHRA
jgi:hypothetical protein